jgi:hypothetical protein
MRNGTGIDLWWQETFTEPPRPYLAEVRFVAAGERVTRRIYERARAKDQSLPPYAPPRTRNRRTFPPETARHLAPKQEPADRNR